MPTKPATRASAEPTLPNIRSAPSVHQLVQLGAQPRRHEAALPELQLLPCGAVGCSDLLASNRANLTHNELGAGRNPIRDGDAITLRVLAHFEGLARSLH